MRRAGSAEAEAREDAGGERACACVCVRVHAQGEEGIDAGGVTREWYTVMAREVFNVNLALFVQVRTLLPTLPLAGATRPPVTLTRSLLCPPLLIFCCRRRRCCCSTSRQVERSTGALRAARRPAGARGRLHLPAQPQQHRAERPRRQPPRLLPVSASSFLPGCALQLPWAVQSWHPRGRRDACDARADRTTAAARLVLPASAHVSSCPQRYRCHPRASCARACVCVRVAAGLWAAWWARRCTTGS